MRQTMRSKAYARTATRPISPTTPYSPSGAGLPLDNWTAARDGRRGERHAPASPASLGALGAGRVCPGRDRGDGAADRGDRRGACGRSRVGSTSSAGRARRPLLGSGPASCSSARARSIRRLTYSAACGWWPTGRRGIGRRRTSPAGCWPRRDATGRGRGRRCGAGYGVVAENQTSLGALEFRTFAAGHGEALVELGVRLAVGDHHPRELLDRVEATRRTLWLAPRATPPSDDELAALLAELRVVTEDLRGGDRRRRRAGGPTPPSGRARAGDPRPHPAGEGGGRCDVGRRGRRHRRARRSRPAGVRRRGRPALRGLRRRRPGAAARAGLRGGPCRRRRCVRVRDPPAQPRPGLGGVEGGGTGDARRAGPAPRRPHRADAGAPVGAAAGRRPHRRLCTAWPGVRCRGSPAGRSRSRRR